MQIIRFENQDGLTCLGTDYDGSSATPLEGGLYSGPTPSDERMAVGKLLPPVDPRAILCIGLNYRRHAGEIGMDVPRYPVVFMKNPAAAAAHGDAIVLPAVCREKPEVDYEAELGVVIGRPAKNVSEEDALSHVLGYTVANDVSARRWQKHAGGGQWVRGKSFDTFCPFGPALVTRDEVPDPQDLDIRLSLNGRILQQSNTGDMIFPVARIISYLCRSTTLLPGTLILTGTPEGVGYTRNPPVYLTPGDRIEISISGVGTLENRVAAED